MPALAGVHLAADQGVAQAAAQRARLPPKVWVCRLAHALPGRPLGCLCFLHRRLARAPLLLALPAPGTRLGGHGAHRQAPAGALGKGKRAGPGASRECGSEHGPRRRPEGGGRHGRAGGQRLRLLRLYGTHSRVYLVCCQSYSLLPADFGARSRGWVTTLPPSSSTAAQTGGSDTRSQCGIIARRLQWRPHHRRSPPTTRSSSRR